MVWEFFRSLQDLERELEARAQAIEQHNPDSIAAAIAAGKLRSVVEAVKEFDREYFDELNICLGYILYRFQEYWGRTLIEHYRVEAMVLRADGPDPEIDFVDVKWWLAKRRESLREVAEPQAQIQP
jgi:hypothetical protein